jgi:uncharacterized protein involved in exopolysaccharide biosynthesis
VSTALVVLALVLGVALVGAVAFIRNADKAEREVY